MGDIGLMHWLWHLTQGQAGTTERTVLSVIA